MVSLHNMADVHPASIKPDSEAIKRLTAKLRSAFEAGEDLGSRESHIRALAETLERTLKDLDREVLGLQTTLSPSEIHVLLRDSGFETMREQIQKLIANARSFSVAERK